MLKFIKKLFREKEQDSIPAKEIGKLAHIALHPKSLLDFALMYKTVTTFEPAFGNVCDVKLVFIGLNHRLSDPAFIYRDKDKAFIVFVGDKIVYQVALKSIPYAKSRRSDYIKICETNQASLVIEVYWKNHLRTTMDVKDANTCNGFGAPYFLKTVEKL